MDRTQLDHLLASLNEKLVDQRFEVLEAQWAGSTQTLRLFIDSDLGINLDDCAWVSRFIGDSLDDLIPCHYRLEVSSPGLERPIRLPRHFKKHLGRSIKVTLAEAVHERKKDQGRLLDFNEDDASITVETSQGPWSFPLRLVRNAYLLEV